jgi:hypothetical protein
VDFCLASLVMVQTVSYSAITSNSVSYVS